MIAFFIPKNIEGTIEKTAGWFCAYAVLSAIMLSNSMLNSFFVLLYESVFTVPVSILLAGFAAASALSGIS